MKTRNEFAILAITIVLVLIAMVFATADPGLIIYKVGKAVVFLIALRVVLRYFDYASGINFKEVTNDWSNKDWSHYLSVRYIAVSILFAAAVM